MGNHRARFPQPKTELAEQALTLPYLQVDTKSLLDERRQRFAIPQIDLHTNLPERRSQDALNLL